MDTLMGKVGAFFRHAGGGLVAVGGWHELMQIPLRHMELISMGVIAILSGVMLSLLCRVLTSKD
jgi:hypothetical protein